MIPPSPFPPVFPRPRLAVSACLLGQTVRYDGGHKRHGFLTDVLAEHVDYLALCPETGIGMGVPRAPIQLVESGIELRALDAATGSPDVTDRLRQFARQRLDELRGVSGYLFKRNSPSCGVRQVALYGAGGARLQRRGTGIYAAAVQAALPLLPVEQEDALDDPLRRRTFITRLYVYRRWQSLLETGLSEASLQRFHEAHTHLLTAHSQAACQRLARMLRGSGADLSGDLPQRYIGALLAALGRPPTRARHHQVQQQLLAQLEAAGEAPGHATLRRQLQAYAGGRLPLKEIIDALRMGFQQAGLSEFLGATYLYPFPDKLLPGATEPPPVQESTDSDFTPPPPASGA